MSFILVTRNPRNRKLLVMQELDDSATEFSTQEEADKAASFAPAFIAWGYQALEVELGPEPKLKRKSP